MAKKFAVGKGRTFRDLSDLRGRTALVVGGAGHIGRTTTDVLLELGAAVAVLDLDEPQCHQIVAEAAVSGGRVMAVPCDLSDERSTREAVRRTIAEFASLDIIVHCAAYTGTTPIPGWVAPFEEQTVRAWDEALRVNLTSAFVIVQEAKQTLCASGHGSVILLSSIYGMVGPDMGLYEKTEMGNPAGYGASKGGLLQLGRYLSTVLGPGIRVNSISPGGIWRDQPEVFYERYVRRTPLARMATEEDLKGAIAYLASDLSSYVTGQNMVIDGGWTAW